MIALALIEDEDKFKKWQKTLDVAKWFREYGFQSLYIEKAEDTINNNSHFYDIEVKGNKVFLESFTSSTVSLELKENDINKRIIVLDMNNDEGDSAFRSDEDSYPDYDIDLSFFDSFQQELFTGITKENGFSKIDKTFGAGRNG